MQCHCIGEVKRACTFQYRPWIFAFNGLRSGFVKRFRSTGQASHFRGAQGTIEDPDLVDGAGEEAVVAGRTPPNAHVFAGRQVVEVVVTRVDPVRATVDVKS